ncbi:hypothetical protein QBC35DRAFT_221575 [Podospora australis]|uniref:Apple domain-containing protein n=1 Tax=Podospora australis TaxID=1536484 RepID=A0AAN7AIE5_9PEZI|nr:hypothetical protein QBC35DRAFT_221575 [Podospora australis]
MDNHQPHGGMQQPYYQLHDNVSIPEKTAQYAAASGPQHSSTQLQQLPQYQAHSTFAYQEPPSESPKGTVLTVKRSVGLATFAVILLLLLTVIGLGAGLGVSQHKYRQTKSDLGTMEAFISSAIAAVPTTQSTPSPTTSVSVAPSSTEAPSSTSSESSATQSSTASSSPSATAALVQCPAVNNTIYTVESTGQRFKRLCGVDYSGKDEAVDVASTKTNSLDLCIEACAKRRGCQGAGWGVIASEKSSALQSCWMKKDLKKFHDAKRPDWGFAVLLEDDE